MEAYRVLVGKPKGKKPLGRPTNKWEDDNNTNMTLQEIGWGGVDLIGLRIQRGGRLL